MRQITLHQLVEQASKANIKAWMPFELTCDGEIIAVVQGNHDVPQTTIARHDVPRVPHRKHKPADDTTGLRFSKASQAAGRMR